MNNRLQLVKLFENCFTKHTYVFTIYNSKIMLIPTGMNTSYKLVFLTKLKALFNLLQKISFIFMEYVAFDSIPYWD